MCILLWPDFLSVACYKRCSIIYFLGCVTESAELVEAIIHWGPPRQRRQEVDYSHELWCAALLELGDVIWYLTGICQEYNIDLESLLYNDINIDQLSAEWRINRCPLLTEAVCLLFHTKDLAEYYKNQQTFARSVSSSVLNQRMIPIMKSVRIVANLCSSTIDEVLEMNETKLRKRRALP